MFCPAGQLLFILSILIIYCCYRIKIMFKNAITEIVCKRRLGAFVQGVSFSHISIQSCHIKHLKNEISSNFFVSRIFVVDILF